MVDIILGIILLVAAVFLVVAVLLQSGKSKGVGTISGGSSETYFGKNKGKSLDKKLATLTTIVAIVFVVIVLVVYVSQPFTDFDDWWLNNIIISSSGSK
ncbi:MAG: preprotein translocase subunit SecG [Clostridia bacterium]|nr:preprotein translocase subunit SecG [Clostridia bacterium]